MVKNNILAAVISTLLLLQCSATLAAEECILAEQSTPNDAKDYIQCLDRKINGLTRQQQSWVNKITSDLKTIEEETGNTQMLPIFKRSIVSQSKYLKDSCKWRYLQKMPNGTQAAINYKRCEIKILEQHIEVLKQPLK